MSIYNINPTIDIIDNKFKNIMDNLIDDISNIFITNLNLVNKSNYNLAIISILKVLRKYLKLYKFYSYNIKNIYIEIYNKDIDVVIYVNTLISKASYLVGSSYWEEFYFGLNKKTPIVYDNLSLTQRDELRRSILDGNFYFYDDIIIADPKYETGIILKKKYCSCEISNCNINSNYIITIYWSKNI